jgi:hypothetical protein
MPTSSRPTKRLEVGQVRLRRREQIFLLGVAQDDAVLDHEATVVAPGGVLRVAGLASPDVARQHAGQEALGIRPDDPVLVER